MPDGVELATSEASPFKGRFGGKAPSTTVRLHPKLHISFCHLGGAKVDDKLHKCAADKHLSLHLNHHSETGT